MHMLACRDIDQRHADHVAELEDRLPARNRAGRDLVALGNRAPELERAGLELDRVTQSHSAWIGHDHHVVERIQAHPGRLHGTSMYFLSVASSMKGYMS